MKTLKWLILLVVLLSGLATVAVWQVPTVQDAVVERVTFSNQDATAVGRSGTLEVAEFRGTPDETASDGLLRVTNRTAAHTRAYRHTRDVPDRAIADRHTTHTW